MFSVGFILPLYGMEFVNWRCGRDILVVWLLSYKHTYICPTGEKVFRVVSPSLLPWPWRSTNAPNTTYLSTLDRSTFTSRTLKYAKIRLIWFVLHSLHHFFLVQLLLRGAWFPHMVSFRKPKLKVSPYLFRKNELQYVNPFVECGCDECGESHAWSVVIFCARYKFMSHINCFVFITCIDYLIHYLSINKMPYLMSSCTC